MKIIKKMVMLINEEINDAEKYANLALKYKDEQPQTADVFFQLSQEEMHHMQMLHTAVSAIIARVNIEEGDTRTVGMKIAYDILHEQYIEKAKAVRVLQSMYNGDAYVA